MSLFRNFFLYLSTHRRVRTWMETSAGARRLTRRFIAGETLDEELGVCARLAADASETYAFVIGLYETNQFNVERLAPWLRRHVTLPKS